ncbi:ADP-ribosylglycohydrolase family protein [bacterium]|nr:ADP-ribosylglycohydrolase family protein [bacterium]
MTSLYDKLYAVLAATRIASSMGAVVECWSVDRIEKTYGVFDKLIPYHHYDVDWDHPAGCTEDGIERQKLMCTAIIKKQDRITAEDLVATWLEALDPGKMKFMTEKFDRDLLMAARSGLIPARELGKLSPHFHINTTARSFHAIPLINAGDIDGVLEDLYEIGGVYQHPNSLAFPWGKVYNAAMVAALEPDATADGVINAGLSHANKEIREHIEKVLGIAGKYGDPMDMRREVNTLYNNRSGSYPMSWIDENVAKSLAIFMKCTGDVRKAIITGVNFGRDTDCTAASAAGLVAALAGPDTIPAEWVDQVEEGTRNNPYTNSRLTIRETADGMFSALRNKAARQQRKADHLASLIRTPGSGPNS